MRRKNSSRLPEGSRAKKRRIPIMGLPSSSLRPASSRCSRSASSAPGSNHAPGRRWPSVRGNSDRRLLLSRRPGSLTRDADPEADDHLPRVNSFAKACALAAVTVVGVAAAQPTAGRLFPRIAAQDITGAKHPTLVPAGESTLVVVMTDRAGERAMRAWFAAAEEKLPARVQRISVVSLKLPFFVGIDTVRSHARKQAPPVFWKRTFVDRGGEMAKALDLPHTQDPFVFAVAADGTVKAHAHGPPSGPEAEAIWRAFQQALHRSP